MSRLEILFPRGLTLPTRDEIDREIARIDCARLAGFVQHAWHVLEPTQQYVPGWHIDAVCEHLEAVSAGEITRLLINVPPGCMKSLLVSVFWPAWEWGPLGRPSTRYVTTSHSESFATRDARKMRDLIKSEWYRSLWGDRVSLVREGETSFANTATGFREAMPFKSLTGARGDRVIIDDPHSVEMAESEADRERTTRLFRESIPTRLNDPEQSAIVIVMQRLHEQDVSGVAIELGLGYEHLMLPMEYEPSRRCRTSIGFADPRTADGELLCEGRFPRQVVERDKAALGKYAVAGQFQQRPMPRGGGIFQRDHWRLWEAAKFPPVEYVVASCDTAYTAKQENDPSALTIWGYWRENDRPRAILMWAWRKWLPLHGAEVERMPGETDNAYERRTQPSWGLVEWLIWSCKRFKVDMLLIESKAAGIPTAQEIQRRIGRTESWGVKLVDPKGDKTARAHAVQPVWANGLIYAPDKVWADMVIDEMASFPRGKYDDITDTATQAIRHMRDLGLLTFAPEDLAALVAETTYRSPDKPLYDV